MVVTADTMATIGRTMARERRRKNVLKGAMLRFYPLFTTETQSAEKTIS
jgi:hypothetical protein